MSGGYQLLLMIAGMHLLGLVGVAVLLVLAFREGPTVEHPWEPGSDDGWGNKPQNPTTPSNRPQGGLPLPDADQARARLRDHRKLSELAPRPERRPSREPERQPERTPHRAR